MSEPTLKVGNIYLLEYIISSDTTEKVFVKIKENKNKKQFYKACFLGTSKEEDDKQPTFDLKLYFRGLNVHPDTQWGAAIRVGNTNIFRHFQFLTQKPRP